jgi:hypothetical protein
MSEQQIKFQKYLLNDHEEEAIRGYCNEFIRLTGDRKEWFRINQDPLDKNNNIYSYVYKRLEESGFLTEGLLAGTFGESVAKYNRLRCLIKRFLELLSKGKVIKGTGVPGPDGKAERGTCRWNTEGIILDLESRKGKPFWRLKDGATTELPVYAAIKTEGVDAKVRRKPPTNAIRKQLWIAGNKECAYCHVALSFKEMRVEHIHAFKDYPELDKPMNFAPACAVCNGYKLDKPLLEFISSSWLKERQKDILSRSIKGECSVITQTIPEPSLAFRFVAPTIRNFPINDETRLRLFKQPLSLSYSSGYRPEIGSRNNGRYRRTRLLLREPGDKWQGGKTD